VTGQYTLSQHEGDGAILLVAGIDPIYATREQSTHYLGGSCSIPGVHLGPEQRRRLIAEMLSTSPEEIAWQTSLETRIEFNRSRNLTALFWLLWRSSSGGIERRRLNLSLTTS